MAINLKGLTQKTKQLFSGSWKKNTSKNSQIYYNDIHDCKKYAWDKVREMNNYAFLKVENLRIPFKKVVIENTQEGENAYLEITQSLYDEFGTSDTWDKINKKKIRLLGLNAEYLMTGQRDLLNSILILKLEIDTYNKKMAKIKPNYKKEMARVAMKSLRQLDPKVLSVYDFELLKLSES